MHTLRQFTCGLFLGCILVQTAFATISIRVFSRDEGLFETNIAKPRFYIQNIGDEPISNFYCYYYFTTELNQPPILDDYYTPEASSTLENLNNGNYRVRFDFTGTTLSPGQVKPNLDGKVVGLHYSNWSVWDKTNDFSNTGLSTFTLNGNIPVYSSSGVLIYGNTPSDPANPPQPPKVSTGTHDFAVLSKEYTDIRDRVSIKGGDIGSGVYVEVGANAVVNGNAYSSGAMFLRSNDTIKGDAIASGMVNTQNGVVVNGTIRSNAQLEIPQISTNSVLFGTTDRTVNDDGTIDLAPGSYKDFHAFSRSTVTLHPGDYYFDKFILETDVSIILKVSNTERLNLNVNSFLRFGDRTLMSFEHGVAYPYSIKIYSAQTDQVFIGNNCRLYGNVICPASEVHVYSNTNVNGALYGKKVVIEPGSVVCKPPLLQDLWHSEWATSPSFGPTVLDYKAAVPDITATLTISTITPSGTIVTINGQSITNTVPLTGTVTNIPILLINPDQCGTTAYNLEVTKMSNFQIFVNDNSPCLPGSEDGNSWSTAYKDLQQAINRALVEGKEIWVAEGTYKPSTQAVINDPRSATFMVYSGVEIIGGFKGNETERNPEGSPYSTILSGDIASDDGNISWPPTSDAEKVFIDDNVYHVITILGKHNTNNIRIKGFTITGGVADGLNSINIIGGAVIAEEAYPAIEECIIKRNFALSHGAGIYCVTNLQSLNKVIFQENHSVNGFGAGLYVSETENLKLERVVFDGNVAEGKSNNSFGGGLFADNSTVSFANCVFVNNNALNDGGAIYNNKSNLNFIHCTITENNSDSLCGGITNKEGVTEIINTIVWNNGNNDELKGDGFTVSYSCVKGGFAGVNNIASTPDFVSSTVPAGVDGMFGTRDDGLMLNSTSSCLDVASVVPGQTYDLTFTPRPTGLGCDIGAYEFMSITGKLQSGVYSSAEEFLPIGQINIVNNVNNMFDINRAILKGYGFVAQVEVPANSSTNGKNSIWGYLYFVDGSETMVSPSKVTATFYRVAGTQLFRTLIKDGASWTGKQCLATTNSSLLNYGKVTVIGGTGNCRLKIEVPRSQF